MRKSPWTSVPAAPPGRGEPGPPSAGSPAVSRLDQFGVTGHLPGHRQVPLPLPPRQLPRHVPLGLAEPVQPGRAHVEPVDGGEHGREVLAELPGLGRAQQPCVLAGAEDDSVHPLHQVERRPDDLGVRADRDRAGHRHGGAVQRGQDAVLPGHVVRGGQHVTERRPAQHQARHRGTGPRVTGGAELQPVGQVRPPAGDQLDRQVLARAGQAVVLDPSRQPGRVLHAGNADIAHATPCSCHCHLSPVVSLHDPRCRPCPPATLGPGHRAGARPRPAEISRSPAQ